MGNIWWSYTKGIFMRKSSIFLFYEWRTEDKILPQNSQWLSCLTKTHVWEIQLLIQYRYLHTLKKNHYKDLKKFLLNIYYLKWKSAQWIHMVTEEKIFQLPSSSSKRILSPDITQLLRSHWVSSPTLLFNVFSLLLSSSLPFLLGFHSSWAPSVSFWGH